MSSTIPARTPSAEQQALRSIERAPLVHRHRPKRFDEVVGQDVPVDYLSGLILRGQACRNILLHGSIGSGKTTLARIYAKALNCERPSLTSGSPCLVCASCISIEEGTEAAYAAVQNFR
jgi:DNA polymerase III gamma/tau subunit